MDSKQLQHPESLTRNFIPRDDSSVRRQPKGASLESSPLSKSKQAFVVENVLTPEECQHYIQECERVGFESLETIFPNRYRSNDRIISFSHLVAKTLFHRILPALSPSGKNNNHPSFLLALLSYLFLLYQSCNGNQWVQEEKGCGSPVQ